MEHHAKFKSYKSRTDQVFRQMEIRVPQRVVKSTTSRKFHSILCKAKKRAANARKDAILKH
jgi:hypothetical protein